MTMKRALLLTIAVFALPSLACSFSLPNPPRVETGPTQTVTINEPAPSSATADAPAKVLVQMGAGELKLRGGAEGLAEGEIDYNVASWKPTITNENGQLTIKQGPVNGKDGGWVTQGSDVVNTWNLKLGSSPMNLTVNAGAYKGQMDLSGLHLRQLTVVGGASDSSLTFTEANPEVMTDLVYQAGASAVQLKGLGYANFEHMDFKGGVGDFQLDFAGKLQRDASVNIETGMSSLRLNIPSGMKATVVVDGGMKNVKTEGTWTTNDKTYETTAAGDYTLTIRVTMGLGELTLVSN
jgi:hypothetical protein